MSKKNQKLKVNFSEQDLQELMNGEIFDWTFTTDKGEDIDIHLFQGSEEAECMNCGAVVDVDDIEYLGDEKWECIKCK